jgi:hypothetical protein
VKGVIKNAPLVISQQVPGEVGESNPFQVALTVRWVYILNGQLLRPILAVSQVHELLRSKFRAAAYTYNFTDDLGVVTGFTPPPNPWWVQINDLQWELKGKVLDWKDEWFKLSEDPKVVEGL